MIMSNIIKGQAELAKKFKVQQSTVSRWQTSGKFDGCYLRIGKDVLYDYDAILEKFKGHSVKETLNVSGIEELKGIIREWFYEFYKEVKNQNFAESDEYYIAPEVCKLLHVHASTLRNWEKKGILKRAKKIGQHVYYKKCDVGRIKHSYNSPYHK